MIPEHLLTRLILSSANFIPEAINLVLQNKTVIINKEPTKHNLTTSNFDNFKLTDEKNSFFCRFFFFCFLPSVLAFPCELRYKTLPYIPLTIRISSIIHWAMIGFILPNAQTKRFISFPQASNSIEWPFLDGSFCNFILCSNICYFEFEKDGMFSLSYRALVTINLC